jgi:putative membrane protein
VLVGLGHATDNSVRPSPVATDRNTQLAEQRTRLSFQRTFLGAERSLMAWIRTSLSMISFGFTMVKFFEYLAQERQKTLVGLFGAPLGPATLGLALISIGTVSLVIAVGQHRRTLRTLHSSGLESRWSLALTVASLVSVLGVFAFGSLVLNY